MSRRDTIIIAVLLNAGLLIVLFVTSMKSDKKDDDAIQVISSSQPEVVQPVVAAAPPMPAAPDDVDQAIKQYVSPSVEQQPNFLADLNAIGMGQAATTPEATTAPTQEVKYKEVKVKKGDVLERIARQNHVSVSELMKANNLSSTRLKIGQTLKIPTKETSNMAAPVSADSQYYVVKAGENPWAIAVKHHMKVEDLLKLNNMDENKAKRLKAGDRLRVK